MTCRCRGERATMEAMSVVMSGRGGGEWRVGGGGWLEIASSRCTMQLFLGTR